ncbi:MAG TPA: carbohydrate kinase family protein [Mycobacteriales bacterium]|jgi:adenosine kinase
MRIAVTGSIATDYLMTFGGRFADQVLPDQIHRLSLSFLADELDRRRGGVAANIAFGMAQLGQAPVLVGAVGSDWSDYEAWLSRHGVDTSAVHVSELRHTARFFCTTDVDQCQIATFYPGAMSEARDIELGPIAARVGGLDLVVVSPNDPEAMRRHTEEAKALGIPFVADPSQQLSSLDGPAISDLVSGAEYLITNDYEAALIESKTGWSGADVLERVGVRITTLGAKGCVIERRGEPPIEVPVVPEERKADPTGVGDAFRAGFLASRAWGLGLERSAQVGTLLATYVLETVGTQEYALSREPFLTRLADTYGAEARDEVKAFF